MTSATERIRALLDERGVEWGASDTYRLLVTSWSDASGHSWSFMEHRDGSFSKLTAYHLTPEQAIASTLGRGTCRQEEHGWSTEGDHARVWLTCGHDCMVETVADLPNFCPVCGAKVVEPTTNDVDAEDGA